MFCLSSRGRFATRILVLLAGGPETKSFTKKEIADSESLTPAYVQQLMGNLQSAGLVIGFRGRQGGFRLARKPQSITVGETLRVMEGCIRLAPCQDGQNCDRMEDCPTRDDLAGGWGSSSRLLRTDDHSRVGRAGRRPG